ncbi:hypothetical protein ACUR5C_01195 [Aliikangiella sp. IMCC44653]
MTNKQQAEDSADLDANEPRAHHYVMAHIALKQIAEQDPHYFFGVLGSDKKRQLIRHLLDQVEASHPEEAPFLSEFDFNVYPLRIGSHPLVIVEMPAPECASECFYIGVVANIDLSQPDLEEAQPEIAYFTLELGIDENQTTAFFCQWDDQTHLNLGEITAEVSVANFETLISQRINPN